MQRSVMRSLLVSAFLVSACKAPSDAPAQIRADGSSTVFPITEAMAEEFARTRPEVRVIAAASGTGGGFKRLCNREADLVGASRPIKASEVEQCGRNGVEFVELPVAYDGLAVVVNPGNTWASSITVAELKRIWEPSAQEKIKTWKDVRADWPDTPLALFGPGVDSGTYDYFTEVVVGKSHSSRGDYTSSEDDNVLVQGVSREKGALGFFGYGYFAENQDKLKLLPVDDEVASNGAGPVAPSQETVRNGTYHPLSRPLFVYAAKHALERAEVVGFVEFYLQSAEKILPSVGYVPLAAGQYAAALQRARSRTTGTAATEKAGLLGAGK